MQMPLLSRRTVGVDVGTFAVHAVALRRRRGRLVVCGAADAPIGLAGASEAARGQTDAVAAVLDVPGCHRGRISAGLAGPAALVRRVTVVPSADAGMPDLVARALESQIPFPIGEACLGWHRLADHTSRPAGAVEVVAVAARRDRVAERLALFAPSGRLPDVLDADACALVNVVTATHPASVAQTLALVHIGHTSTLVCVVERGAPVFVRDVSIAGRRYLQALDREIGLGPAEALRRVRAAAPGADPGVTGVLDEVHRLIAAEVVRALQLSQSSGAHAGVQQIWVSGGGSRGTGLLARLEAALGVPVQLLDPFGALPWEADVPPVEWKPAFAVAVGLALRDVGETS